MKSFCILIFGALCSAGVWATESTTLSAITSTLSSVSTSPSSQKSSTKVKRQYQYSFPRPPNYSPFVGDAAQRNINSNAQTINQVDQKDLNGNYNYAYETTNGIKVRQTSYMIGNQRVLVGYYSYVGDDGKIYTTRYTADQFGYRAVSSHLPVQDTAFLQPLPVGSNTPSPEPIPFISSTPAPFISSTPYPFISSTPAPSLSNTLPPSFVSSTPFSFNNVPSPSTYRGPYQHFNGAFASTTPSPIGSSSTPFASTVSPLSVPRRPPFPIYSPPFQGYNPRINRPYSVVSSQTPAPLFYQYPTENAANRFSYITAPSNINRAVTTTLAPPHASADDFNNFVSSTASPFSTPIQFKQYIPPVPSNEPGTVIITPKPSIIQPQLPNSLSINVNENLLPPYLSVGPLNASPGPLNNFISRQPFEFNDRPQTVAPLTVTNLNYRKKRDFDKD